MTFSVRGLSSVLMYVGIGFFIQYFFYSDDFTFSALVHGAQPISTYAHILAWPLFVMFYFLFCMMWVTIFAFVIFLGYIAYDEITRRRRVASLRKLRNTKSN